MLPLFVESYALVLSCVEGRISMHIRNSYGEVAISLVFVKIGVAMDLTPFKKDIDELIKEFARYNSTTLADMKRVWLARKFSFIYEAKPTTNLGFFMQSLYAHSIGHMLCTGSLSQKIGGLYCLYCLYETQPFKPPFKIYLSRGELKKLRILVADAKEENVRVLPALVKRMLDRNLFLFGSVDINDSSVTERLNEITNLQNARMEFAYEKVLANTPIERLLHMDLSMELDLKVLKKISTEYAAAKELAIKDASKLIDVQNIEHIAENKKLIGEVVEEIVEDWNEQKELFHRQTGFNDARQHNEERTQVVSYQQVENPNEEDDEELDEYGRELEDLLD
ncbi:hypothetical protein GIB67_037369 [Kingdonia uniflora]|uniref:Uncharacterized protein n=1 Tax=Kingdonia uniflora TaxID=39325 RepID=A0A7J7M8E6_9MAGN|nr:hypothetical protein GIB67_037369 [Kingdonia uniflora]